MEGEERGLVERITVPSTAGARRLLQIEAGIGGESATVDVQGIMTMNRDFGVLYTAMIGCIMRNATDSTVTITGKWAKAATTACSVSATVNAVVTKLLTCGKGTSTLLTAQCNKLYDTLSFVAPTVAFDWYWAKDKKPKIVFKLTTTTDVGITNDAIIAYNTRKAISTALEVDMDRVLVEIRMQSYVAGTRRLHTPTTVIYVWVYESANVLNWPTHAALITKFEVELGGWRTLLIAALKPFLDGVVIDAACETDSPPGFTTTPFQPLLKEHAVAVAVDFGGLVNALTATTFDAAAKVLMVTAIKEHFAKSLAVLPTDIRVLSIALAPSGIKALRIAAEIRVDDAETAGETKSLLIANAAALQKSIEADVTVDTPAHSVHIVIESIKVFSSLHDGFPAEGLSGGAIAGIVIGVLAFVAIAATLVYWWMMREEAEKTPEELDDEKAKKEAAEVLNNAALRSGQARFYNPQLYTYAQNVPQASSYAQNVPQVSSQLVYHQVRQ